MKDDEKTQPVVPTLHQGLTDEDWNKPLALTDRDLGVMTLAHEERYICYSQIKDGFWPEASHASNTARRRVRKMIDENYLWRQSTRERVHYLYLLGERGYQLLKSKYLDRGLDLFRFNEDRESRLVDHNLKVVNIRLLFREFGLNDWTPERILSREARGNIFPDGVIHLRGHKIAIEFENELKSNKRYRERFWHYARRNEYLFVIFVTTDHLPSRVLHLEYNKSQVGFVEYSHLMHNKEEAEVRNKNSSFVLAEMF